VVTAALELHPLFQAQLSLTLVVEVDAVYLLVLRLALVV
jgi:hypothetical protein